MDFHIWLLTNLDSECFATDENGEWKILFDVVLWSVWRNRNLLVFDPNNAGHDSILLTSRRVVNEHRMAMDSQLMASHIVMTNTQVTVRWRPLELLEREWLVEILHIPRGANWVADGMAKIG
ncbi:hypothetical protein V6N12_025557 [Hibiscus sabdariffa]|uniref:Uncharacterized protein n=1 Tax=Hibiscus sabdariffa TaxID=183260 RepID=A0ABR2CIV3_9ROSI